MSVFLGSAYAELNLDLGKFRQGMKDAKADLKVFGTDIDSVASGLQSAGKSIEGAGKKLTKTVTAPVLALGAAAVKTTADFDSSMSQVYATMGDKAKEMVEYNGKTVSSMEALRDYAQEMGATTKFTASQAADALNYMALAGYDAQTSMSMLPNVLNLAAAGNMDLARASDMVTDTQTAFGISLDRTTQMVDEMAKAASTGNTSVEQLGDAFLTVGGLLQETNGGFVEMADGTKVAVDNVQEMEIALTAMANAGVKGSEAGTHMRNMLLKLASPTKEGYEAFDRLGISIYSADGKMKSLNEIFTELNGSLENLTQEEKLKAISDIFNTRDTAAAEALLKAVGQDWDKIGESILNAEGAASTMADTQLDNLNGQLTILKSGIEGLLIQIGDIMMPYLKKITERIQNLVTYLISLDEQQKRQIAKWLAIAAAIGPVLMVVGKLTSGIGSLIGTFSKLAPKVVGLAKGFGLISAETSGISAFTGALGAFASAAAPILAVIAAITALTVGLKKLYDQGGEFKKSVDSLFGAIKEDISSTIGYFKSIFGPVYEGVLAGIESIKKNLGGFVTDMDGSMAGIVELIHTIHDAIAPIIAILGDTLRPLLSLLAAQINMLFSVVLAVISGVLSAIGPLINTVVSAVNVIIDNVKVVIAFFKGLMTGDFTDFKEAVAQLWEDIKSLVSNFIDTILSFLSGFATTLWASLKAFFSEMLYNFGFWIGQMLGKAINFFENLKENGPKKAEEIWEHLKQTVKNFPSNFKNWLQNFPKKVSEFIPSMKKAGIDLLTGWWDGLKKIWKDIQDWFSGVLDTVKNFLKGITDGMNSARSAAQGSHAGGLSYVPYDGYIAQLHEGERVLTRNEAEDYNKGNSGSRGGDTFIFNSPKALDPYESNRLFAQTIKEREEGFYD